jgi:hypothetical protein
LALHGTQASPSALALTPNPTKKIAIGAIVRRLFRDISKKILAKLSKEG